MSDEEIHWEEQKRLETRVFVFIAVVLFPLASVALVGTYALLIWISQIILGPPGV